MGSHVCKLVIYQIRMVVCDNKQPSVLSELELKYYLMIIKTCFFYLGPGAKSDTYLMFLSERSSLVSSDFNICEVEVYGSIRVIIMILSSSHAV